jgi:hypothetical protein
MLALQMQDQLAITLVTVLPQHRMKNEAVEIRELLMRETATGTLPRLYTSLAKEFHSIRVVGFQCAMMGSIERRTEYYAVGCDPLTEIKLSLMSSFL